MKRRVIAVVGVSFLAAIAGYGCATKTSSSVVSSSASARTPVCIHPSASPSPGGPIRTTKPAPDYVGRTLAQANAAASMSGVPLRVLGDGGTCFSVLDNLVLGRVDVETRDDVVIAAEVEVRPEGY